MSAELELLLADRGGESALSGGLPATALLGLSQSQDADAQALWDERADPTRGAPMKLLTTRRPGRPHPHMGDQ